MSINAIEEPMVELESRASSVRSVLMVSAGEQDQSGVPRMGITNVVSRQEKVPKDGCDMLFAYALALAPAAPSGRCFRLWERLYIFAIYATFVFQCLLIFFEIKPKWDLKDKPRAQLVCNTLEVVDHGLIFFLTGLVNPMCFYAARGAFEQILKLRLPPADVKADDDRKWRWAMKCIGWQVMVFSGFCLIFYTIVWGDYWGAKEPLGGPLSEALVVAWNARWLQVLVYCVFAPMQNLINVSVPFSFIAVHALLVQLIALCMERVGRLLLDGQMDPSHVLDAYHDTLDMLHTVMQQLKKRGIFDVYILFVIFHSCLTSVQLALSLFAVEVEGVTIYGAEDTEPRCFTNGGGDFKQAAVGMTTAKGFYVLFVVMFLLGWGNHLSHELLKKLPRGAQRCSAAKTPEAKRELLKWLRECITTAPVEFKVAGIRINWERAGVLVFAQLLPLFSKLVVSVFGAL